jgi:hypothetical protein
MVMNKRGLSDVITVSLIILLAIAAVVIVWTFVRPTIEGVGKSLESSTDCIKIDVEAVSCGVASNNVVVQLVTSGGTTVNAVNAILIGSDGSRIVREVAGGVPPELATGTASYSSEGIESTDSATAAVIIQDADGNAVTCPESSVVISCN